MMHPGKVDVKRIARPTRCQSVFLENCRGNLFSTARGLPRRPISDFHAWKGETARGGSVWAIRFAECKFAYLLMVGKIAAAEIILLYRAALLNLSSGTKGIFFFISFIYYYYYYYFFFSPFFFFISFIYYYYYYYFFPSPFSLFNNNNAFTIIERPTEVSIESRYNSDRI